MSYKHLRRYVTELAARHFDPLDQMTALANGMEGKWLRYSELTSTPRSAGRDRLLCSPTRVRTRRERGSRLIL